MIDPVALASITSAVAVLGNEYLKGLASDAGKSTWMGVKSLLGWTADPTPAEIPSAVAKAVSTNPEMAQKILELLKQSDTGTSAALVSNIEASGGKVVVANTIVTDHFQM